jgi:hypothetical protein
MIIISFCNSACYVLFLSLSNHTWSYCLSVLRSWPLNPKFSKCKQRIRPYQRPTSTGLQGSSYILLLFLCWNCSGFLLFFLQCRWTILLYIMSLKCHYIVVKELCPCIAWFACFYYFSVKSIIVVESFVHWQTFYMAL